MTSNLATARAEEGIEEGRCAGDQGLARRLQTQNEQLASILGAEVYVSANKLFCGADGICVNNLAGNPLFRDTNHLTPFGSEYLVGRLAPQLEIR